MGEHPENAKWPIEEFRPVTETANLPAVARHLSTLKLGAD
jgi:hypothetical protein